MQSTATVIVSSRRDQKPVTPDAQPGKDGVTSSLELAPMPGYEKAPQHRYGA